MAAFPWTALISAGGSLLGGLFDNSADEAAKNARQQREAIAKSNRQNLKLAREQMAYADEYNKNKVAWTVEDARRAGLHPLAALGSAVSGGFAQPVTGQVEPEYGGGTMGSRTGSAVGDAISVFAKEMQNAQVENARLANEEARLRISQERLRLLAAATSRSVIDRESASARTRLAGIDFVKDPNFDDAQVMQDRWGEWAEWVFGPAIFGADAISTAMKADWGEVHKQQMRDLKRIGKGATYQWGY